MKLFVLCLLFCLVFVEAIIDSDIASLNSVVSIQVDGRHRCTGVIVDKRWILTSAQCVHGLALNKIQLRYHSNQTEAGGSIALPESIHIYAGFSVNTLQHDIAAIRTDREFLEYSSLTIGTEYNFTNRVVTVYGWRSQILEPTKNLHRTSVSQIASLTKNDMKCAQDYAKLNIALNLESTLCLAAGQKKSIIGICELADAGSPAADGEGLLGIASFSKGCGNQEYPGIFTAVAKYREWLRAVGVPL